MATCACRLVHVSITSGHVTTRENTNNNSVYQRERERKGRIGIYFENQINQINTLLEVINSSVCKIQT